MTFSLAATEPEPELVLRYAESQPIDLYGVNSIEDHLVIVLHGGFWRSRYDRCHLRPFASWLASQGLAVALPEFRRVGDAGGGWPGTLRDVEHVVRHLSGALKKSRTTLLGHSSGGHLALLAACYGAEVDRTVALAGILDLADAHRSGLSDNAVSEFLGLSALATADPMALELPRCGISLVHGTADAEVPMAHSVRYASRHPSVELQLLARVDHYALIDPTDQARYAALSSIRHP